MRLRCFAKAPDGGITAWLIWSNRRMGKECERKVQTSETLIAVAIIRLLIARYGRGVSRIPRTLSAFRHTGRMPLAPAIALGAPDSPLLEQVRCCRHLRVSSLEDLLRTCRGLAREAPVGG